ncbi:hypothetical protein KQX54_011254 [Cotesia glomerata]|uniref:FERM domain-containing protein n=1 Tax=Cotesia glomerata TaxID=32391 RepID=A0AAV7I8N0_COTGL|nr:hypothetical protein KQX54_011254 [Cotesia glomerata]
MNQDSFFLRIFFEGSNLGQELLDRVFRHLNLLETAYFGLRYLDHENQMQWLDPSKKIGKQLKIRKNDSTQDTYTLYFGVKFYAADPCKLIEEITRYQFFLQVKQDIFHGRLPVSFDLAAELGAYVVQWNVQVLRNILTRGEGIDQTLLIEI